MSGRGNMPAMPERVTKPLSERIEAHLSIMAMTGNAGTHAGKLLAEAATLARKVEQAPKVTVQASSETFGHGSYGTAYKIGDDYDGKPACAALVGHTVALVEVHDHG